MLAGSLLFILPACGGKTDEASRAAGMGRFDRFKMQVTFD